ncbi:class I SAM-dependent methyltransferase, partial [Rubricoccus marinus]
LSPADARRVYDRVGASQDKQGWYEDAATDVLIRHGEWADARDIYEMGCGTGRLAAELLPLAPEASYTGTDLSPVMAGLARQRLVPWADRATVRLSEGGPASGEPESCDRVVATYVLDLLSEADARGTVEAAHRLLRPSGLLCLAGLGPGHTVLSRMVAAGWRGLWRAKPEWVGGCRPVALAPLIGDGWDVVVHERVAPWGVPSEALIARKR